jgi:hypothetical protein
MDRYRIRMTHHAVRALLLGGLSLYLILLSRSGEWPAAIEPGMVLYVKLAALGLVFMGGVHAALLFRARSERNEEKARGCPLPQETSSWRSFAPYAFFVLPLAWGLLSLSISDPQIAGSAYEIPAAGVIGIHPEAPAAWFPDSLFGEPDDSFGFGE